MSNKYSTDELRVSYGVGRQMGDQLKQNAFEGMDVEAVQQGLADAMKGNPSEVDASEMQAAYETINKRLQAQQEEASKSVIEDGAKFLADNAARDGVSVTDSGLQYEIITQGDGDKPTGASTVRVHYHGTLLDGTVFDSSVDRGQPAEFPVNGVIPGWTEALQLMGVGDKWKLTLPHEIAYGERGAGGAIGPYSTLVFEVELLEIIG